MCLDGRFDSNESNLIMLECNILHINYNKHLILYIFLMQTLQKLNNFNLMCFELMPQFHLTFILCHRERTKKKNCYIIFDMAYFLFAVA